MNEKRALVAMVGDARREYVREALLSWFRENARDLPWRRTRDPWRVLVSEVMLQQIQVKRAVPFYERFVARFPTVEALAEAPLAEAIRAWADLGRYRRIVYLHRTARIVVEEYGGVLPTDPGELVKLPGVGPYTAGAVACFAFEGDVAFLDTNMRRVLQRVFFGVDPAMPATEKDLLKVAVELVPSGRGWEWNQALMETGALLCTARKPLCGECPLREECSAHSGTLSTGWPQPERKEPVNKYEGSNRHYRGKVLAQLREDPRAGGEGITLRELGGRIRADFDEGDARWLQAAIESLCKDGLAKVSSDPARPGIIAEERVPYGRPKEPPLDGKVSLP
ncbi:MAG: A/G-specific adenine glycosylase [Rubrobacter sp.]